MSINQQLANEMKRRFPWLGTSDEANGADAVEQLNEWYDALTLKEIEVLHIKERGRDYYFVLNTTVGNLEFYVGKHRQWKMRTVGETDHLHHLDRSKCDALALMDLPAPIRSILIDYNIVKKEAFQ